MTMSKTPIVIATGVAVIIAGYLVVELRAERRSVAQLRERVAALEAAVPAAAPAAVTPPVAALPQPPPEIEVAQPGTPAPVAAAAPPAAPPPSPAVPKQQVLVMRPDGKPDSDPTAGARAILHLLYGDVEKELGLSADQMNALVQLTARGNSTPAEIDAAIGGKYPMLQELSLKGDVTRRVTQLRSSLASSAHPLNDLQAEQLNAAMMEEFRRKNSEIAARTKPTDPADLLDFEDQNIRINETSNRRLIAAAQSHLAAEQIAVLKSTMDMLLNAQRRTLQTRRARFEAGGSAAADPPGPIYIYPQGTLPPGVAPRAGTAP